MGEEQSRGEAEQVAFGEEMLGYREVTAFLLLL